MAALTSNTDWSQLERVEFETLQDVWDWTRLGQQLAAESGLVLLQARGEFHAYMKDIAANPRGANRRAMVITRQLNKAIEGLVDAKHAFSTIPGKVVTVFEEEISAARTKNKPRIDLSK